MPHARGVAPVRRNLPETRRHEATKEEDGRASRIAADRDVVCSNPVLYAAGTVPVLISTPPAALRLPHSATVRSATSSPGRQWQSGACAPAGCQRARGTK